MPAKDGFNLTEGDVEIVHVVHRVRAGTLHDHIAPLTQRPEKALRARLLKLAERGYIVPVSRFMQKHIYVLGNEAKPVLVDAGLAPGSIALRRIRDDELKPITMQHLLFVSDILTKLFVQERESNIKIVESQHDGPALWDYATGPDRNGSEKKFPVRPDLKLILKDTSRPEGRNVADFFVEADRSTMSLDRMEDKIRGYLAYHREQRYMQKYPGMRMFQVLTITETAAHAPYLEQKLAPVLPAGPARRAYHFVPFKDLSLESLFRPNP